MTILNKHPAPWRGWNDKHDFTIVDANGNDVFPMQLIVGREAPDELKRLILAAPELLAALKGLRVADDWTDERWVPIDALIARIEQGEEVRDAT